MHPKKILTIFRKDVRDAVRDARVLFALLLPIGLGLFYNAIFDDSESRPKATVAIVSAEATTLPDALESVAGSAVDLTFRQAAGVEELRRLVDDEDADVGLVLPAGFDRAVRQGQQPAVSVLIRQSPGFSAQYVVSSLGDALRGMAGQQPPAAITIEQRAAGADAAETVFEELGIRRWMVLFMVIFLAGMVSVYVVPVMLTEEGERRTLDALTIIASYLDVVTAKALVGLAYLAITVPALLLLTRLLPADVFAFTLAMALLSVTLIGFGLLLGGVCRTTTQVNTWSSVVLLAITFPALLVTWPLPDAVISALGVLPSSQAMRLASNALSGTTLFENAWLAYPIIAAWGVAAYGILLWRLSRREA